MKGEIYNFVLFSDIGTGTVANKYFFVDWNFNGSIFCCFFS